MLELHQLAAAIYLAAGIGALTGLVLPAPRMLRGASFGLLLGAIVHGFAFATLHRLPVPPPLTDLSAAGSFMAWIAVLFLLVLAWRMKLSGLVAVAGPVAFLVAFLAAQNLAAPATAEPALSGSWPHAHVLLASAGLALLGVAGVAGIFFLLEHRRLKRKRPMPRRARGPSLEALDRVNAVALAVGFPLLTLGVLTGMLWVAQASGVWWSGSRHETWTSIAWAIYAGLSLARFVGRQGARQSAASAVGGFAFLLFAVIGVDLMQ